jgi:hypothetical protein
MAFANKNAPGPRPSTAWNNTDKPLSRDLTPPHEHEFGTGQDVQYKDKEQGSGTPRRAEAGRGRGSAKSVGGGQEQRVG